MKAISDILGVARSNLAEQAAPQRTRQRRGRRPQPEAELVAEIKALIAGQPTYGYRRHRLLRQHFAPPLEQRVRVQIMPVGHDRYRCTKFLRLSKQPDA